MLVSRHICDVAFSVWSYNSTKTFLTQVKRGDPAGTGTSAVDMAQVPLLWKWRTVFHKNTSASSVAPALNGA